MVDLFREFWWLAFPLFGFAMAAFGSRAAAQRSREARELVRAYVQQGRTPPVELVRAAAQD